MALSLLGGTVAAAQQLPPGITLPPKAPDTTSTTAAPQTSTTRAAPTTLPPTTAPPENQTRNLPAPDGAPGAPGGGATPSNPTVTTTAARPGDPPGPPPPPPPPTTTAPPTVGTQTTQPPRSLSPGQVAEVLRSQQRSGASSTSALVEALKPLQNLGMTMDEALTLGMGRFPLLGVAYWTDDWLDPRTGPPPHQHQGNDLFAAFDVPVRAPVDGTVRFEDAGLGGKGAFVTAPDGTYYYMAHLNGFARDLGNGAAVKQGQIVGYNGDSGNAKGGAPHVHFEIHPRGGAAIDPKPVLDAWVAEAMAKVPELIASFQPKTENGATAEAVDVPQILMSTGMTRRFSAPSIPVPGRDRPVADFNRAVLGPLTPQVLAPLIDG